MRIHLLTFILTINFLYAKSQEDTLLITEKVFELGEVTISEKAPDESLAVVRKEEIFKKYHQNVAEILGEIPGVIMTNIGARNESTIFLRGYDTRQISLLVDGVPVYIPYDGNIDLGRFLSWNYEKVVVSKGFASMLYGSNAMGGAVNLITSVPEEKIELQASTDMMLGNTGYNGNSQNIKIGSRTGKLFFQGSFARYDLSRWDVSNNYEPGDLQPGGERVNSFEKDNGFSFRMGFLPGGEDKYVISYSHQDGQKGIPLYDGEFNSRFWRMPEWDKRSLYFNSKTTPGNDFKLLSRVYYDRFMNTLEAFDDETFTTRDRGYAFTSIYDDYSAGGSVQLVNSSLENNEIAFAVFYKHDNHLESTGNEQDPVTEISDNTMNIALENVYRSGKISLTGGISWNYRNNSNARQFIEDNNQDEILYPSADDQSFNFRAGAYYSLNNHNTLWLNSSANSRFATMKERYSFRLGRSIPNPDLGSERALHFNAGHRINSRKFRINTEVFYSLGSNKITNVNISPDTTQFQNIENTRSFGTDISISYHIFASAKLRLDYSYLHIENTDDSDFYFIDLPEHSFGLNAEYRFAKRFIINGYYRYISERYSYTDGTFPQKGYGIMDINFSAELLESFILRFSLINVFDVNYFYAEGYPGRGRMYKMGLYIDISR